MAQAATNTVEPRSPEASRPPKQTTPLGRGVNLAVGAILGAGVGGTFAGAPGAVIGAGIGAALGVTAQRIVKRNG